MRSCSYHPQSDGQAEIFIRSTKNTISKILAAEGHGVWDKVLPKIALALNTCPSITTGFSPYFLEHGTEAILPADLILDNLPPRKEVGAEVREASARHRHIFRAVREVTGRAQV